MRVVRGDGAALVDGARLSLEAGQARGLVGESGSGKTLLALASLGLLPSGLKLESGEVRFGGEGVAREALPGLRGRKVAMVMQEPLSALNPVLTVGAQIAEVFEVNGADRAGAKRRAVELLERVGIADAPARYRAYPHQLSGGMRQRALIAAALACEPQVLIADEPTTALDVTVQAQILALLDAQRRERGLALVLILARPRAGGAVVRAGLGALLGQGGGRGSGGRGARAAAPPVHGGAAEGAAGVGCAGEAGGDSGGGASARSPAVGLSLPRPVRERRRRLRARAGAVARRAPLRVSPPGARSLSPPRCAQVPSPAGGRGWREAPGEGGPLHPSDPLTAIHRAAPPPSYPPRVLYEVTDLGLTYPSAHGRLTALEGISLTLARGETLGIVGESGAGKSTLVRALLGFARPDRGTVRFGGVDLFAATPAELKGFRRRVQPVFQDPASSLDPLQPVRSVLREPLEIIGLPTDPEARIQALLAAIGLDATYLERRPHELSAGQRQRVCIARALAVEPECLLLDEPVSALDVSVQAQILTLLEQLKTARGLSYVVVSHDLAVVAHLATRVAVLYGGRLVEDGPARVVLERPTHPYTRALLAAARSRHDALAGDPPSPFSRPSGCIFRSRCPKAFDRCAEPPPLREVEPGHRAACWLD